MTPEVKAQVEELLAALKNLHAAGQLPDASYHKSIVAIAYEYFVDEDPESGVRLLMTVPVSYFKDVQPQQMVDDPQYAYICQVVARKLVLHGYVLDGNVPVPTQSAAKA